MLMDQYKQALMDIMKEINILERDCKRLNLDEIDTLDEYQTTVTIIKKLIISRLK